MDSKKPNRRKFLQSGAALASLAGTAGVAKGQTQGMPEKKIDELVAYGERSRFVTSIRMPVAERHSPDEFGLMFHVLTPLQDSSGIITPSSLLYFATHRGSFIPDIDPKGASPDDPRDGGPAADFYDGRAEAAAVRHRAFTSSSASETAPGDPQNRSGNTRPDQLRRMDGRAAVPPAQRGGGAKGASWIVAEGSEEVKGSSTIALAQSHGRLHCVLRHERRAAPSPAGLSPAADGSRF